MSKLVVLQLSNSSRFLPPEMFNTLNDLPKTTGDDAVRNYSWRRIRVARVEFVQLSVAVINQVAVINMASTSRARVLVADDHVLVAEALCKLLSHEFEIVAMVHDGRKLIEAATKLLPDVILVDVSMPVLNGLHAAERIKRQLPNVKILCVTVASEPEVIDEALRLGLDGYVIKTCAPTELLTAIRFALEGKCYISGARPPAELSCKVNNSSASTSHSDLTDRQLDIVQLLAEGRSMKEAASVLNLTTRTVAFHKYRAMRRLNLRNDSQVVQYAVQHHIIANDNR